MANFPDIDDTQCTLCGQSTPNCICPQCPICLSYGDPLCYLPYPYGHSLPYNRIQLRHHQIALQEAALAQSREDRYWDDLFIDHTLSPNPYQPQRITFSSEAHRECLLSIATAISEWSF